MKFLKNKTRTERARELRNNMTPHEMKLWRALRYKQLGMKFRRQQPIDGYVSDFCCFEKRLIIELDGAVHEIKNQKEYDYERDRHLKSQGFTVLRFWNDEIEKEFPSVIEKIKAAIDTPTLRGFQKDRVPPPK